MDTESLKQKIAAAFSNRYVKLGGLTLGLGTLFLLIFMLIFVILNTEMPIGFVVVLSYLLSGFLVGRFLATRIF